MLSKTQLQTAKTAELLSLQSRIAAELQTRQQERIHKQQPSGTEQLFVSGKSGHYQWEFVSCGHTERCNEDTNSEEGGARHDLACIIANAPMIRQNEDWVTRTIRPLQPKEALPADTRGQQGSLRGDTLWSQPNHA